MSTPTTGAAPMRSYNGPTLRAQSPRGTVRENSPHSRWTCPACGSADVQVRLPVWFREYQDGELVEVSIDSEADPQAYYCGDCFACESGSPVRAEGSPAAIAVPKKLTRDFRGYYQFRSGKNGSWQFYVCGFSGPPHANGTDSLCRVLRSDGTTAACVPIDAAGHITILGRKYGRNRWHH